MKIFLSHRSRDKATVRDFARQLPAFLHTWLDEETLEWGDSLSEQIQHAIDTEADFLMVFLGEDALDSAWVQRELGWALERERALNRTFVLPVVFGHSSSMPENLSERVHLTLPDFTENAIERLSKDASEKLFQLLVKGADNRRAAEAALERPPDLVEHLSRLTARCWNLPHVHHYHVTTTLRPHADGSSRIVEDTTISFQIRTSHLNIDELTYDHRFLSEMSLPAGTTSLAEDVLLDYVATCGSARFGRADVTTSIVQSGGRPAVRFELLRRLTVRDATTVRIRHRLVLLGNDRSIAIVARYPTRGFTLTLSYSDQYDYEVGWFKSNPAQDPNFPGHDEFNVLADGITAETYGWLLPGEGLSVMWVPRS